MALFRVNASQFPRHFEVKTRCLMTAFGGQSGNGVALTNELSKLSGSEIYTFLRLTSCSFSDRLYRFTPIGAPERPVLYDWAITETGYFGFEKPATGQNGECSAMPVSSVEARYNHAPPEPTPALSWSTTTSVDIAGWTEVVIQGGRNVLSDVSTGHSLAMVNTSINDVPVTADTGSYALCRVGNKTFCDGAMGCPGLWEMNNSSISCPSFNEVTI